MLQQEPQPERAAGPAPALDENRLLWVDMEMSGLSPDTDRVLELAMVVTDAQLNVVAEGRTTLLIAHRLQTAMNADRIVVVDGGRVVEQGTHAELVDAGGHYAELWDLMGAPAISST